MPQAVPQPGAFCAASVRDRTVHALFEEQAASSPDAAAVLEEDRWLSYARLNRQANRLAHHLLGLGVGRGDLVGLCLERCPEVFVGLLAILKAGAAYVPLDPTYPDDRLAFMLRDTAAPLVMAHGPTAERLAPFAAHTRILNLDAGTAAPGPDHNPDVGTTADHLVYVMYTSGSTGTPKGVLVSHRAVVRLVRGTDYSRFGPDEVFLHLAPLAFDASTFEIRGPLLNGAAVTPLPPVPPTPNVLDATICRHGVTTLWLTAGLFHLSSSSGPSAWLRCGSSWPAGTSCHRPTSGWPRRRCATACWSTATVPPRAPPSPAVTGCRRTIGPRRRCRSAGPFRARPSASWTSAGNQVVPQASSPFPDSYIPRLLC
jgi:non-ribosomal peptide synthetase component F